MADSSEPAADESEPTAGKSLVGSRVERREDAALVTGEATYTGDIEHPGMVHMAVLRSQYGHAEVGDIDTDEARELDGVVAVFTASDIEASDAPGTVPIDVPPPSGTAPDRPLLAAGRVRYQGEPLAVVVAEDRYRARDAIGTIDVAYERVDAVADPIAALESGAPTLHDVAPDNVAFEWELGDSEATDEAFESATHVVDVDLENQRVIPNAMEPRAAVATYTPSTGALTVEMTTQNPHLQRRLLAETLGVPDGRIRVRAPAVGGGFGSKIPAYPAEALAAWCAMELGKPVKWQATRTESYLSDAHGRNHRTHAELALDDAGTIHGLRVETRAGVGAHLSTNGALIPTNSYGRMLSGQYDIPTIHCAVRGVYTNTTPVDAYRGAGRPEACYVVERLLDVAARELDADPVALRRRNFIATDEFPHEVATGHVYDSGDYEPALDKALELVDYEDFRERQARLREEGRYVGIGLSAYVEACGSAPGLLESGLVRVRPSGTVAVECGTADHGQGHATTYAQIVADVLGVPYEDVSVTEGDTAEVPEGSGTYGSRSVAVGGSALRESAEAVVEKAREIAAHRLEAAGEDVEFDEGTFRVTGAPERSMTIQEVAGRAYGGLPEGIDPGLEVTTYYDPENYTFPFGTHVAVVDVDVETGEITVERYVAVDDVGTQVNPKLVEGQVHGGTAQGIGQALYERAVYDENAQLVTGSMQDYTVPKAEHVPHMETDDTVTPSPHNPLGAKGAGEAGAIAAPPAVVNAVCDALAPFGVEHIDMPLTEERVWRAIRDAEGTD